MTFCKKLYAIAVFIFFLLLIFLFIVIYNSLDKYRREFKVNIEATFSTMTASKVSIERVSGSPLRKIYFKGMIFDFGRFKLDFDSASLEYSLFDILSNKAPAAGVKETVLSLSKGSFILENNAIISRGINGRIRLRQGKILLDDIIFIVFDQVLGCLNGEIINNTSPCRVELDLDIRPVSGKEGLILNGMKALVTGPIDNLTIRGRADVKEKKAVHFRMYSIYEKGIFTLGSRVGIETDKADINHLLSVDAVIDPAKERFNAVLTPNEGTISLEGSYDYSGSLSVELKNQQLKVFGQDFSNKTSINVKTVFKNNTISHLLLDMGTQASVVNYQPISEIEASLMLEPKKIRLIYVKIGDTLSASGSFNGSCGGKIDLSLTFNNFVLENILSVFIENRPDVSGTVSGRMDIDGTPANLLARVRLISENGNIGDMDYNKMIVNAEGTWPFLKLTDSRITHKDLSLMLNGELDMRNFASTRFLEDISVSTTDKTIVWEGWDITRIDESGDFLLQRSLGNGIRLGYKTHMEDETKYDPSKKGRDEFQLEYDLLYEDSVLEFRAKEREEFFGIKKKYKF
ncbi:MAG: hypothetical protein PHV77_06555 [Candidatus Omnitrophica bacterium]|jgi:hypothetical protein|nr:hypothetical protein [Candidatus Omnitrophota bacterium]